MHEGSPQNIKNSPYVATLFLSDRELVSSFSSSSRQHSFAGFRLHSDEESMSGESLLPSILPDSIQFSWHWTNKKNKTISGLLFFVWHQTKFSSSQNSCSNHFLVSNTNVSILPRLDFSESRSVSSEKIYWFPIDQSYTMTIGEEWFLNGEYAHGIKKSKGIIILSLHPQ